MGSSTPFRRSIQGLRSEAPTPSRQTGWGELPSANQKSLFRAYFHSKDAMSRRTDLERNGRERGKGNPQKKSAKNTRNPTSSLSYKGHLLNQPESGGSKSGYFRGGRRREARSKKRPGKKLTLDLNPRINSIVTRPAKKGPGTRKVSRGGRLESGGGGCLWILGTCLGVRPLGYVMNYLKVGED